MRVTGLKSIGRSPALIAPVLPPLPAIPRPGAVAQSDGATLRPPPLSAAPFDALVDRVAF